MKIGIITQPIGPNIGGILQNMALQHFLVLQGHEPLTLNYVNWQAPGLKEWLRINARKARTLIRRLRGRYERYIELSDLSPLPENTLFCENVLNLTKPMSAYSHQPGVEAYVVGSDQVWRPRYNKGVLNSMFLDFVEGKKLRRISYAASLGTDQWEYTLEQTASAKRLLSQFDAVSVREESAKKLLKEHLGVAASVVLDPTLLLSRSEYDPYCEPTEADRQPVLAGYLLDIDSIKLRTAHKLAKELDAKFIDLHPNRTSVGRWLGLISNARCVLTDSFHATVFSIIFQRQFVVMANPKRGNARLKLLLDSLGLSDRMAHSEEQALEVASRAVDWTVVNQRLNELRSFSVEFLSNALTK